MSILTTNSFSLEQKDSCFYFFEPIKTKGHKCNCLFFFLFSNFFTVSPFLFSSCRKKEKGEYRKKKQNKKKNRQLHLRPLVLLDQKTKTWVFLSK